MNIFLQIFSFLVTVFILVTLHELGHFLAARLVGVKVLRFSIGFGKPIWQYTSKAGTEYALSPLLLGGYVKMLDGREQPIAENERAFAFDHKPLWARATVVMMGPVMNFLIAIFAFWLTFLIGVQHLTPVIGKIIPNSIAAHAGLKPGQQILQIDDYKTPEWSKAMMAVVVRMGETGYMQLVVENPKDKLKETHSLNLYNWQVDELNPEPLSSLGIIPYMPAIPPIVHEVASDSPAAAAGIKKGDKILEVDNQPIHDWLNFVEYLQAHYTHSLTVKLQRGQQVLTVQAWPEQKKIGLDKKIGYLGLAAAPPQWPAGMRNKPHYTLLSAWEPAWQQTRDFVVFNAQVFSKMLTGQLSLKGIGGPITVFTSSSIAFKQGMLTYINFLAIFSLMLGFVNLLPVPGLDGGHLLYFIIEGIRGKPLRDATQVLLWRIGFTILIVLMVQATINDLLRLFITT